MAKDITVIECKCSANPDLNGTWYADDMKQTCNEVGIPEDDWIDVLFYHLFSDYDNWTSDIQKVFLSDNVISMKLMVGFYPVTLTKGFNRA